MDMRSYSVFLCVDGAGLLGHGCACAAGDYTRPFYFQRGRVAATNVDLCVGLGTRSFAPGASI